jgi:hypothetical protein
MSEIDDDFIADRTFSHLNASIKLADQKASLLLSGQLTFIGLYLNFFGNDLLGSDSLLACSSLVVFVSLAAVCCAGAVITPRTVDADDGLFLWKSILQRESHTQYEADLEAKTQQELRSEVLRQNYHLAQVATRKYRALKWALAFSGAMLLLTIVSVVVWLG